MRVTDVHVVDDCLAALAERRVEVRLVPRLQPYVDAVVSSGVVFSAIRMRNATPSP